MTERTRRRFLQTSGALLGGIAVGTSTTAAASHDRFIINATQIHETSGVEIIHRLNPVNLFVVRGSERDVRKLGGQYAPDFTHSLDLPVDNAPVRVEPSAQDEPLYDLQWDKQDQHIPETHEITRGENTRVAIIDSGVAAGHPDLQHAVNVDLSRNFTGDDYGAGAPYGGYHGTHVAGIVAANDRNEKGVVGTAPATEIVDCRVFSTVAPQPTFSAFFGDVLAAIVYSAEIGADAANLSLGGYFPRKGFGKFWGKALNSTTTYANRKGTLLVHAAGNVNTDLQHDKGYVDSSESAQGIGVSATGPIGFKWGEPGLEEPFYSPAYYTNYGTNAIDLGAPGGDIARNASNTDAPLYRDLVLNCIAYPSYTESGEYLGVTYDYDWLAGTSMAAPQVTGAAALVKSANPTYNANQIESALKRAASVPEGYNKTYYGSGYLNPLGAVQE